MLLYCENNMTDILVMNELKFISIILILSWAHTQVEKIVWSYNQRLKWVRVPS